MLKVLSGVAVVITGSAAVGVIAIALLLPAVLRETFVFKSFELLREWPRDTASRILKAGSSRDIELLWANSFVRNSALRSLELFRECICIFLRLRNFDDSPTSILATLVL
ncbi:hypothetical protein GQX74_002047 [Glossina fuscipes]|nr:hypothetical protein GQX74_002047 [Glossina fuscipes]